MSEEWRPVADFEALYEVSNLGNVRSLDRTDVRGNRLKGRLLGCHPNNYGYAVCDLCDGAMRRRRLVSHMVLTAFVSPRPDDMDALHGPEGNSDDSVSNLRWGTKSENQRDRVRDGTSNRGKRQHLAKLDEASVREIRILIKEGAMIKDIATNYSVTPPTISAIKSGYTWSWVS